MKNTITLSLPLGEYAFGNIPLETCIKNMIMEKCIYETYCWVMPLKKGQLLNCVV